MFRAFGLNGESPKDNVYFFPKRRKQCLGSQYYDIVTVFGCRRNCGTGGAEVKDLAYGG